MYSSLVLKSERTDKRTLTCMALDDWKLGVKKIFLGCSLGNLKIQSEKWDDLSGIGIKNTFGTLEKKRNQYLNFFWKLVTEKSVSQNVKLGVVFGTFYCGIYVD